jgi:acetyl-CoA carboxylase biotin carboxyl carrier protein
MKQITSMMAGIVAELLVSLGDTVKIGQDVVMLESMKMQLPITAEIEGQVKEIRVKPGDFVNEGDVLITLT